MVGRKSLTLAHTVHRIRAAQLLVARSDRLAANVVLAEASKAEADQTHERDAAVSVWQGLLSQGRMQPEMVTIAQGWVLDQERRRLAAQADAEAAQCHHEDAGVALKQANIRLKMADKVRSQLVRREMRRSEEKSTATFADLFLARRSR